MPEAVARKIQAHLDEFYERSQLLLEALNHQQVVASKRVAQSIADSGWPLTRTYQWGIARRLQSVIRWFEAKTAYRNRWLLSICLAIATFCLVSLHCYHCSRYKILQNSSIEQLADLQKQYETLIDQRAAELTNKKLQTLQPRSYTLAQTLEKYCHRVELTPGNFAWELKIHAPSDFPSPHTTYDADLRITTTFYLPDTNGEISLSKTAPSISQKAGKKP